MIPTYFPVLKVLGGWGKRGSKLHLEPKSLPYRDVFPPRRSSILTWSELEGTCHYLTDGETEAQRKEGDFPKVPQSPKQDWQIDVTPCANSGQLVVAVIRFLRLYLGSVGKNSRLD